MEEIFDKLCIDIKNENVKQHYFLDKLARECQTVLKKSKEGNFSTIVIIGRNGIGKSFFLNLLIQMSMVKNYAPVQTGSRILKNAIFENHPMLSDISADVGFVTEDIRYYLDKQETDNERLSNELFKDPIMKNEEEEVEKIISNYYLQSNLKPEQKKLLDKHSFIFPCGNSFDRTTTVSLCIRFAYIPACSIFYIKKDEISIPPNTTLEEMLLENDATMDELDEITKRKVVAHWGKGFDLKKDRIFIREKLKSLLNEKLASICIKRIVVYLPLKHLQLGSQIIDIPGFDDDDHQCKENMMKTIEDAETIFCITDKSLGSSKQMCDMIEKSRIIEKMMNDPIRYNLIISHISERTNNLDIKSVIKNTVGSNEMVQTKKKLDSMILQIAEKSESNQDKIKFVKEKIEIFTLYPFLFTSLIMEAKKNVKFFELHKEAMLATRGFKMLGVIQKVLYGKLFQTIEHFVQCKLSPLFGSIQNQELSIETEVVQKDILKKQISEMNLDFDNMEYLSNSKDEIEKWVESWKTLNSKKILDWCNGDINKMNNYLLLLGEELICQLQSTNNSRYFSREVLKEHIKKILENQCIIDNQKSKRILNIINSCKNQLDEIQAQIKKSNSLSSETDDIGIKMFERGSIFPDILYLEKPKFCKEGCILNGESAGKMIECESCKNWYHMGYIPCVQVKDVSSWICQDCETKEIIFVNQDSPLFIQPDFDIDNDIKKDKSIELKPIESKPIISEEITTDLENDTDIELEVKNEKIIFKRKYPVLATKSTNVSKHPSFFPKIVKPKNK